MTQKIQASTSDEYALTANVVTAVTFAITGNRLTMMHTGLAADARIRFSFGVGTTAPTVTPSNAWTTEEATVVRLISSSLNNAQVTSVSVHPYTSRVSLIADQNCTVSLTMESVRSESD